MFNQLWLHRHQCHGYNCSRHSSNICLMFDFCIAIVYTFIFIVLILSPHVFILKYLIRIIFCTVVAGVWFYLLFKIDHYTSSFSLRWICHTYNDNLVFDCIMIFILRILIISLRKFAIQSNTRTSRYFSDNLLKKCFVQLLYQDFTIIQILCTLVLSYIL